MPEEASEIRVRPVTAGDWPILEELFGAKGACGGCWCMLWRSPAGRKQFEANKGEPNRKAFRELVESGDVYGCLAFAGEVPAGWCSIGPRTTFPGLARSRVLRTAWTHRTWSITCFYIPSLWRGRGVATALLQGAIGLAEDHGADVLEAYPVKPRTDATPVPAAFAWTGVPRLFESAGFENITPVGQSHPIFRLVLSARPRPRAS